jgi:hypothetical protein
MKLEKLIELCNKYTIVVSFNGFDAFKHKVIDAEKLLAEIHTTTDISREDFILNVKSGNFMTPEYETIFKSIKFKGITKGLKKLSGNAYIEYKSLYWL